ncbi:hypothetical protein Tco_1092535 [Tanacetum coccineum]|uniref:Uncharacterized protein n=1 Tax=Tanacetum coccineum TaxID=301880 RepID=A0ABQ5IC53_9ASTR
MVYVRLTILPPPLPVRPPVLPPRGAVVDRPALRVIILGDIIYTRENIEYSEEEEAKAMAETMEQYMSKTRTNYGSGVARSKIEEKDSFELKGQFLKELRENTFLTQEVPFQLRQLLDAKKAIQEMAEYSQKWHNGTSRGRSMRIRDGLADIQA